MNSINDDIHIRNIKEIVKKEDISVYERTLLIYKYISKNFTSNPTDEEMEQMYQDSIQRKK